MLWYTMRNSYGTVGKHHLLVLHQELRGALDVDEQRVDSLDVFDLHLHETSNIAPTLSSLRERITVLVHGASIYWVRHKQ